MDKSDFVTDGTNYLKKSEIIAIYTQGEDKCSLHLHGAERASCFIFDISSKEAEMQLFLGYEFAPRSAESVLTEEEVENANC